MTPAVSTIHIPDHIRRPAVAIIGALASRAGDMDEGMTALDEVLIGVKPADRTAVIAAALLITFGECITDSNTHTNPVPVDWTAATTEGETE